MGNFGLIFTLVFELARPQKIGNVLANVLTNRHFDKTVNISKNVFFSKNFCRLRNAMFSPNFYFTIQVCSRIVIVHEKLVFFGLFFSKYLKNG